MKSYTFGLLQTNSFKALKGFTATLLAPHGITTYQWALLGILYETPDGLGTTALAKELRVSKPFITKTVTTLRETGWIEVATGATSDNRNTIFVLSKAAERKIPAIEKELQSEMRSVLSGITKIKLLAHVMVLKHILNKLEQSIDTSAFEVTPSALKSRGK